MSLIRNMVGLTIIFSIVSLIISITFGGFNDLIQGIAYGYNSIINIINTFTTIMLSFTILVIIKNKQ